MKIIKNIFKITIFSSVFLSIGFFIFNSQAMVSNQNENGSWFSRLPIIGQIKHLAESADKQLKGEDIGRINIVLLGMGGKNHEGGLLTDTIILSSLDTVDKKVAMMSIPRDLSIPVENVGYRKINAINAYAEMNKKGSGGMAVSQTVSDLVSMPIDYYLRIDFSGFENIVNRLGNLSVYVENTFDDYRYPVRGREEAEDYESRFEHLHFDKGWQKMDGALALKYARSRHAYGIEGSDFARARRQQNIIMATKEKLLSTNILLNPKAVLGIINEVKDNFDTNLKIWEIIKLWRMFKDVSKDEISNRVLDNSPSGLLVDKISEQGAYILTPRSGDFSEIQYLANNIFIDAPKEQTNFIKKEGATLEVRNGTWINGLASQASLDLEKYGFKIIRVGNSSKQNFQKTVIYDLTYGQKDKSLSTLRKILNANISLGLPEWLIEDLEKELENESSPIQPDFIIILGQEADQTDSGAENPEN